jgi:hypothetical protein
MGDRGEWPAVSRMDDGYDPHLSLVWVRRLEGLAVSEAVVACFADPLQTNASVRTADAFADWMMNVYR